MASDTELALPEDALDTRVVIDLLVEYCIEKQYLNEVDGRLASLLLRRGFASALKQDVRLPIVVGRHDGDVMELAGCVSGLGIVNPPSCTTPAIMLRMADMLVDGDEG